MKLLLDECFPRRVKHFLSEHTVATVSEMGWNSFRNGKLMTMAVEHKFDVLLTVDKNLEFQQNIKNFPIAIIVFDTPRIKMEYIKPLIPKLKSILPQTEKGKAYKIS